MISKAEHELHVNGFYRRNDTRAWSRIQCPDCDQELSYDPTVVTASYPPMRVCACVNNHIHRVVEPVPNHQYPEHHDEHRINQ